MRRSWRTWTTVIVLAVVATAGVLLSRGTVSYVVTHGASMEPGFHQGDLAVVVPAGHYRVGDVVAYRSELLDTVVMHRIIGRDGSRYVFKGDNNSWDDRDRPTRDQLVGRLLVRAPGAGRPLAWLTGHWLLAAAAFVAATTYAGVSRPRRRRKKGQPMGKSSDKDAPGRHPSIARVVLFASGGALLASALLGAVALTRPTERATTTVIPYTHRGTFAYSAPVTPGSVYDSATVHTGDPIFRRLVSAVDVRFDYRFDAEAVRAAQGAIILRAYVSDTNGWHRSLDMGPAAPVVDGAGRASASLDIGRLQATIDEFEASTGVRGGSYAVGVEAEVRVAGMLAAQPLRDTFPARIDFSLDAVQLRPAWTAAQASAAVTPTRTGSIRRPAVAPRQLGLPLADLDVGAARGLAGLGVGLSALVMVLARRQVSRQTAAARIAARHGHRIVPVASAGSNGHRAVVDVISMDDLVRLATQYDCLILHEQHAESDRYLFQVDRTVYRFILRDSSGSAEGRDAARIEAAPARSRSRVDECSKGAR